MSLLKLITVTAICGLASEAPSKQISESFRSGRTGCGCAHKKSMRNRLLEADGEDKAAELLLQLKSIAGHGDLAANCRALAMPSDDRRYRHPATEDSTGCLQEIGFLDGSLQSQAFNAGPYKTFISLHRPSPAEFPGKA